MKIKLYILGLLLEHGEQHGYSLLKLMNKNISHFTEIKMPSLYYHIESLNKNKHIAYSIKQKGLRPEKYVYSITEKGISYFKKLLKSALAYKIDFDFLIDPVLFFSKNITLNEIESALNNKLNELEKIRSEVKKDQNNLTEEKKIINNILIKHQTLHFDAEINWLNDALKAVNKLQNKNRDNYLAKKI